MSLILNAIWNHIGGSVPLLDFIIWTMVTNISGNRHKMKVMTTHAKMLACLLSFFLIISLDMALPRHSWLVSLAGVR